MKWISAPGEDLVAQAGEILRVDAAHEARLQLLDVLDGDEAIDRGVAGGVLGSFGLGGLGAGIREIRVVGVTAIDAVIMMSRMNVVGAGEREAEQERCDA